MMTRSQIKSGGFTLIEAVMYIGIFSIVVGGSLVCAYQILEDNVRNHVSVGVVEEGMFVRKKIEWALTNATAANVTQDGKVLTVTRPDLGTDSPIILRYFNGNISLSRGVQPSVVLNTSSFPVDDLSFSYQDTGSRPASVRAAFYIRGRLFTLKLFLQ